MEINKPAVITLAQSLCYPDQFNAYQDNDLIATIAIRNSDVLICWYGSKNHGHISHVGTMAEAARLLEDAA